MGAIVRKWNTYKAINNLPHFKILSCGVKIIMRTVSKNPRTPEGPDEWPARSWEQSSKGYHQLQTAPRGIQILQSQACPPAKASTCSGLSESMDDPENLGKISCETKIELFLHKLNVCLEE